jgi:hypothetical protein
VKLCGSNTGCGKLASFFHIAIKKTVVKISFQFFYYRRYTFKIVVYIVLKIISGKWRPPLLIHRLNRILLFLITLQHIDGYVGHFLLNVSFQVLQSLWAVGIETGFQIPPQKNVTRGQIGWTRRPLQIPPQWDEAPWEVISQHSHRFFFFCESPFICKLYKYIQQMV